MRVRTLSLAILLVAAPAVGVAQTRAPQAPRTGVTRPPASGPRLDGPRSVPRATGRPALPTQLWTEPRVGVSRRPAVRPGADDRWRRERDGRDRHDGDRGRRRSRPVIVYVSPYAGYGVAPYGSSYGGYYGGSYGGSYVSPLAPSYTTPPRIVAPPLPASDMRAGEEPDDSLDEPRDERADDASRDERVVDVAPVERSSSSRAAAAIAVERVGRDLLRLRWTGRDAGVREVELVVADAARRVIATQSVRRAPWTAVFDRARVAYVGTTLVRADGTSTTTLVPLVLRPVVQTPIRQTSPGGPALRQAPR